MSAEAASTACQGAEPYRKVPESSMSININSQARRPMSARVETVAEPIKVDSKNIACDGGGGQLGHPRVYLAFDDARQASCPYCGQKFVYEPGGRDDSH